MNASSHMTSHRTNCQAGFGMIEVLVTLIILLVGLLGLAGMMVQSQRSELESYQRVQALILLQDMVGRINSNRKAAACYNITDAENGTPYLGNGTAIVTPSCDAAKAPGSTADQQARAIQDMTDWNALLQGVAEISGADKAGAMAGARGCISYDVVAKIYTVSVAWQGLGATATPSAGLACAKNQYGDETERRVVSSTLKLATLD